MATTLLVCVLATVMIAQATTPSPPPPTTTTCVIISTDPHGWVSSHRHAEEKMDADYADLAAFVQRYREAHPTYDVAFVENGDFCDGGGLSDETLDGTRTRGTDLFPILSHSMGFDARGFGNHEMYHTDVVQTLLRGSTATNKKLSSEFVTSNIVNEATGEPLGARWLKVPLPNYHRGDDTPPHHHAVVMSFLYDMTSFVPNIKIENVEDAIMAPWFASALLEKGGDMLIVLAHMGYNDKLISLILNRVHQLRESSFVVLFVAGHTHIRASRQLGSHAFVFEPGKYMDTVGLVCINYITHDDVTFSHSYLDANKNSLAHAAGLDNVADLDTTATTQMRKSLQAIRHSLGLDRVVGHLSTNLHLNLNPTLPHSLWGYFISRVAPTTLFPSAMTQCPPFFMSGSGALRYDLFAGAVTVDDLWGVAPFTDTFIVFHCVKRDTLQRVLNALGNVHTRDELDMIMNHRYVGNVRWSSENAALPVFVHSVFDPHDDGMAFDVIGSDFDGIALQQLFGRQDDPPTSFGALNGHSVWLEWFFNHNDDNDHHDVLLSSTSVLPSEVVVM